MGSKLVTTEEPLSLAAYVAVWLCAILTVVIIGRQPVSDESLSFKVGLLTQTHTFFFCNPNNLG